MIGLSRDDAGDEASAVRRQPTPAATSSIARRASRPHGSGDRRRRRQRPAAGSDAAADGGIVPIATDSCSATRPSCSLRVDDVEALSTATKRAQQIARSHGGSVASLAVRRARREGVGAAQITLPRPDGAASQSTMAQLSQLGTIVGQRYGIDDLQQQADSLQSQIEATQRQIAQTGLAGSRARRSRMRERAVLQCAALERPHEAGEPSRRAARHERARRARRRSTSRLTTEEIQAIAGRRRPPRQASRTCSPGRRSRALYALVVVGPFVLVGLLVWLVLRLLRRRETARLLEQN